MQEKNINELRFYSYKMTREIEVLRLEKNDEKSNAKNWHILIEIEKNPKISISNLVKKLLLHISTISKAVSELENQGFIKESVGYDKREKFLQITKKGRKEIKKIDEFSEAKISNAFRFLGKKDKEEILQAIRKYADALEKSRVANEMSKIKIRALSTSRTLRLQIVKMISDIQKNEFQIEVPEEVNSCVIKAEDEFYYNNSCNFFYAINEEAKVIGCVGLKALDKKHGEIKKFFVDKNYRGQNVGRALMTKLLAAAKKHKFHHLCLGSVDKLDVAQKFYLKCGFEKIDSKKMPKNFVKNNVDNVFFCGKTEDIIIN